MHTIEHSVLSPLRPVKVHSPGYVQLTLSARIDIGIGVCVYSGSRFGLDYCANFAQ